MVQAGLRSSARERRFPPAWSRALGIVLAITAVRLLWPGATGAQSHIGYSLVPSACFVNWNKDMGMKNAALYGVAFSSNLDEYVSIRARYLTNSKVPTDLARLSPELTDRNLRLDNYGVDVAFNLGHGDIMPFVTWGGGVLRFKTDSGKVIEQIALKVGGGLRYQFLPHIHGQVVVEDLLYRIDRIALAGSAPAEQAVTDPGRDKLRSNLAVSVGVGFDLGDQAQLGQPVRGVARRDWRQGVLSGRWLLEPFGGRLKFDDKTRIEDCEIVGGRIGLNVTENLGVRGYYWHGMTKGYNATYPAQSWGGEAQFFLARGEGALPYLVIGVGSLDFLDKFRDLDGQLRSDRMILTLGGGIGFSVGRNARINIALRDHTFSEPDLGTVGSTDKLRHNLAFTGGVTLIFGGRQDDRLDSFGRETAVPLMMTYPPGEPAEQAAATGGSSQSYQSDKAVVLPVPSVGELYVRYGEPGAVSVAPGQPQGQTAGLDRETISKMISQEIGASSALSGVLGRGDSTQAAAERLDILAADLAERIGAHLDRQLQPSGRSVIVQTAQPTAPQTVVIPPTQPGAIEVQAPVVVAPTRTPQIAYAYTGINVDHPTQWIFGFRLDAAPIRRGSKVRFVPEVAPGFFSHGSFMVVANAQYDFSVAAKIRDRKISPYVYAGAGIIRFGKGAWPNRTEAVLNLGYGLTVPVKKWTGFIEHQGVDLFSLHRVNVGIRWTAPK